MWKQHKAFKRQQKATFTKLCPPDWTNGPIYVCGYILAQPLDNDQSMIECEKRLISLNIGSILNVAIDCIASKNQREFYQEIEIHHGEELIQDEMFVGLPPDFLNRCVAFYNSVPQDKSCLIHCALGINRSAAAAAAILWSKSGSRPWQTMNELIEWMRKRQLEDRKCELLFNTMMVDSLNEWSLTN